MPHAIAQWFSGHGIIAKPGASVFLVPWAGTKANTTLATRIQTSGRLGGGSLQSDAGAQNSEWTTDIWLDDGTYKYAQLHSADTNRGIYSVQLDTVEKGTIDGYAASTADNTYSEITGIAVTKGLKVFKIKMATKNASSASYYSVMASSAWIRTGA